MTWWHSIWTIRPTNFLKCSSCCITDIFFRLHNLLCDITGLMSCFYGADGVHTSSKAAHGMALSASLSSTLLLLSSSREVADNAISLLTTYFPSLKWPQPTAIYGQPHPSWLLFASCRKGNNKSQPNDSSALTNVCTGTLLSYGAAEEEQCCHWFHRYQ